MATSTEGLSGGPQAVSDDVAQLHTLGYVVARRRRMSGFSNFAVSFTIISVLSGASRSTSSG